MIDQTSSASYELEVYFDYYRLAASNILNIYHLNVINGRPVNESEKDLSLANKSDRLIFKVKFDV